MQSQPKILGILNITEDSFSDGGKFLAADAALAHGRALMAGGADILDIGPAASNPDAKPVPAAEEIRRLESVVPALMAEGARVSVDSFQSETQLWALRQFAAAQNPLPSGRGQGEGPESATPTRPAARGRLAGRALPEGRGDPHTDESAPVHYLNDIHGFADAALYPRLAAAHRVKLIVMHAVQQEGVATREKGDAATIWERILAFFEARLKALGDAGIARERLILDPGMGLFLGAGREVSLKVLRDIALLKQVFGLPVLVSVSRKSFLRRIVGREVADAGPATLAAEIYAAGEGVDYIRTHDPRALKDALTVLAALAEREGQG